MEPLGPKYERTFRSQSAMEYLMTYGWAILIIAVVLAALFELGVFNPMTFAPKASPGSCQVIRPEGPDTTNFISLEGECNGEIPQYVAAFQTSSYIAVSTLARKITGSLSVTGWVYLAGDSGSSCRTFVDNWQGASTYGFESMLYGCAALYIGNSSGSPSAIGWSTSVVPTYRWKFIAVTYNETTGKLQSFVGGTSLQNVSGLKGSLTTASPLPFYIGAQPGNSAVISFNGLIANVQLYNTALSANEIQALYQEGIGGAPINVQSLVAWWPLNGNTNDYSGNGNNGVPTNVTYTTNWYSSYSAP